MSLEVENLWKCFQECRLRLNTTPPCPSRPHSESDKEALLGFFEATGGPRWKNNSGWGGHAEISTWHGVGVNKEGRVNELVLAENQLYGEWWCAVVSIFHPRVVGFFPGGLSMVAIFSSAKL